MTRVNRTRLPSVGHEEGTVTAAGPVFRRLGVNRDARPDFLPL